MTAHALVVLYVVVVRLAELFIARRNTRRLLAQGAYEVGQGHYYQIVSLHVAWILVLAFGVETETAPALQFLVPFLLVQVLRFWTICSLGQRWTTRILILPGADLVRRGPYRWLRHPNYLVVVAEITLLPLVFGAWKMALGFSIVNALVLSCRIRIEDEALSRR